MKLHTHDGVTQSLKAWAKQYNILYNTLYGRLQTGRSLEDCLAKKWKRKATRYTHDGVTQTIEAWAEQYGMSYNVLSKRLRDGHSITESLPQNWPGSGTLYTHNGVTQSLQKWATHIGLPYATLYGRISRGYPIKDCLIKKMKYHKNTKRKKVWTDEKLQKLLSMRNKHATLVEMGKEFGVTRERIRQVLNKELSIKVSSTSYPEGYVSANSCMIELDITKSLLLKLLQENESIPHHHDTIAVPKSLIPILQKRLALRKIVKCGQCGIEFTTHNQKRYCSNLCRKNNELSRKYRTIPKYKAFLLWHKEIQVALQDHEPSPLADSWDTISVVTRISELSPMQITWLRHKEMLSTKPHPTDISPVSQRPVTLYSISEIEIAGRIFEKYNRKGDRWKRVQSSNVRA